MWVYTAVYARDRLKNERIIMSDNSFATGSQDHFLLHVIEEYVYYLVI